MIFEVEAKDEWSAWRMDRYIGRLHRRRGPLWIVYDADGALIGKFELRREAVDTLLQIEGRSSDKQSAG